MAITAPAVAAKAALILCWEIRHDRFCSLSWYDRQLVENSTSGDEGGDPLAGGEEEEQGEEKLAEAAAVGGWSQSQPLRLYSSDGVGFGVRARPAQASVMATLKASSV